ncbi:MAG TPA: hypothetical protein VJJ26_01560 [Candidatus Babeliales bacterium]|nr:hypothetical protein [Candidatus Babeliales bacterium]
MTVDTTSDTIRLINYDISFEPLSTYTRSKELEQTSVRMRELLDSNYKEALKQLPALIEKYPNDPTLAGYLAAAHTLNKDTVASKQLIIQNYNKFPTYFFARCMYADLCIQENNLEEAAKAIDNKFDLKILYPDRSVFHVSELLAFCQVCTKYFGELGDYNQAQIYVDIIKQLDDEHPLVENLESYLFYCAAKQTVKQFFNRKSKKQGA